MWTLAISVATFIVGVVVATLLTTPLQRFWDMRGRVSRVVNEHGRYIRGVAYYDETIMELAAVSARV